MLAANQPTKFHFISLVMTRATHSSEKSSNSHLFMKRLSSFSRYVARVCARLPSVFFLQGLCLWLRWYFRSSTSGRRTPEIGMYDHTFDLNQGCSYICFERHFKIELRLFGIFDIYKPLYRRRRRRTRRR